MVNVITCKSTRKLGWRTSFSVVTKPLLIFCIKHILCCCSSCSQTSPIKYVHLFYHYSRYKVTQVSNPNTISLEIIVQSSIRYRALYVESTASTTYTINDQEKKEICSCSHSSCTIMIKGSESEYGSKRASF